MNAHREYILMLLRENQQTVTLVGIEECRLIISIFALVSHKVPADDLVSYYLDAPLTFAALFIRLRRVPSRRSVGGSAIFRPSRMDRWRTIPGGTRKRYVILLLCADDLATPQVLSLNQVILSYLCGTTSSLKSGSGYPVFVTGAHRGNGGATKYIGTSLA